MLKLTVRLSTLSLFTLVLSFGIPRSPQAAEPTERVPNYDVAIPPGTYPRWMSYTRVDPMLVSSQAPPPNQNPLVVVPSHPPVMTFFPAVAVDSRGVAHVVDWINTQAAGSIIVYYNTRYDTRQPNGFSPRTVLFTSTLSDSVLDWPDVCVDSMDRVHVVWAVQRTRTFTVNGQPVSVTGSDVVYRILDPVNANGWLPSLSTPPTNLSNAVITPSRADRYYYPQIVTDPMDNYHIPCVLQSSDPSVTSGPLDLRPLGRETMPGGTIVNYPWRIAINPSGVLCVVAQNPAGGGPASIYWSRTPGGTWSGPAGVGPTGGGVSPDVAVDSMGNPHFAYYNIVAGNIAIQYSDGAAQSQVNLNPGGGWPRIAVDSRDQIHVFYQAEVPVDPQAPTGGTALHLAYAARVKNPNPDAVSLEWRRQEPMASTVAEYYRGTVPRPINPPPNPPPAQPSVEYMVYPPTDVAVSRNDVLHLVDGNCTYTRTLEYGLGVRESIGLVGALPQGAANVTSGNLHFNLGLYSTQGVEPTQAVGLIHNSLESYGGLIGPGWKLNFEIYLVDHWLAINNPNGGYTDQTYEAITVFFPDGRPVHFRYHTFMDGDPTRSYLVAEDEFGVFTKLQRTAWDTLTPEYILTFKSGDIWTFNNSGKIREIRNAAGNCITFTYMNGCLVGIADQKVTGGGGGRGASLDYDSGDPVHCPRVISISDPAGHSYNLSYENQFLRTARFTSGPSQPTWEFQYYTANSAIQKQRINLLKLVSTPRGHAGGYGYTCRYLQDNRIIEVEDPEESVLRSGTSDGGAAQATKPILKLKYTEPAMPTAEYQTYVTSKGKSASGQDAVFLYVNERRRGIVKQLNDPYSNSGGIGTLQRIYNDFSLLTQEIDRYGCQTNYSYFQPNLMTPHVRDNLMQIQRSSGSGAGMDTIQSFTYAVNENFTRVYQATRYGRSASDSSVTPRVTEYQYDSGGRLTSVTHPAVTRPDGVVQTATTQFVYGGPRGALSSLVNEEGNATTFSSFHSTHALPQAITAPGASQSATLTYDAMGNQITSTAPAGGSSNDTPGASSVILDGMYRASSSTDPAGRTTTYEYDLDSNSTSVQPPAGGATSTTYDHRGFVSGGSSPDGSWLQWVDEAGNVERVRDIRQSFTNYDYDSLGRLIETRSPGGSTGGGGGGPATHTTQFANDIMGGGTRQSTMTQVGSPNRTTTTSYDIRGRPFSTMQADGQTTTVTTYNELDEAVAVETLFGSTLQNCMVNFTDARGRQAGSRTQNAAFQFGQAPPTGSRSSWSLLDKTGAVVQEVGPRGDVTMSANVVDKVTYVRDERGRVTQVQEPVDGQMTTVRESSYGDDDLVTETRMPNPADPSGGMVVHRKCAYTARKEIKSALNANNEGTTYVYSLLPGQVDTATDAGGIVTRTTYDTSTQRVDEVIEGYGTQADVRTRSVWQYGLLSQTQVYNPSSGSFNATFQRTYDAAGRLERLEAPQMQPEVLSYNAYGELSQHASGAATAAHTYNSLGQLTATSWSGAYSNSVQKLYDGQGNLTRVDDGTYRKEWTYDPVTGRPTSELYYVQGSLWKTQTLEYDDSGNLTRLTDGESNVHQWIYDDANRVIGVRYAGIEVCSMAYTRGGLLALTTLRNAQGNSIAQTRYEYDSRARRVRALTTRTGSGATLSDLRWEYDTRDRVTRIRHCHLGVITDLDYNFRGEVISEVTTGNGSGQNPPDFTNPFGGTPTGNVSSPSAEVEATPGAALSVANRSATYAYDRVGNRTSQTIGGVTTTLAYDSGSRLVSESRSGWSVTHTYDTWGNETGRTTVDGSTTTVETFGYNYLNRMSSYVRSVGQTIQAQWQYDCWPTGERYAKTNLATNVGELYVSHGDNVVTEYSRSSSGTIALTNSYAQGLGLDQKSLRIPASGSRIHYLGDMVGTLSTTLTDGGMKSEECVRDIWGLALSGDTDNERYGFAQRENDTESGLVYMRHREYDSRNGRFTQTDPLLRQRATLHYTYVANQPVSQTDPSGEFAIPQDRPMTDSTPTPTFNDTVKNLFKEKGKDKTTCVILYLQYPPDIVEGRLPRGAATTEQIKAAAQAWKQELKARGLCDDPIVEPIDECASLYPYDGLERTLDRIAAKVAEGINYLAIYGHGSRLAPKWGTTGGLNWPTPNNPSMKLVPMTMGTRWRETNKDAMEKKGERPVPADMHQELVNVLKSKDAKKGLSDLWQLDLEACYSNLDAAPLRQAMGRSGLKARVGGLTGIGTSGNKVPKIDPDGTKLWGHRWYYGP